MAFNLRDPLWGSKPEALSLTANIYAASGLSHLSGVRDYGFESWVERFRLGVNGEYDRWRGLLARCRRCQHEQ